MYACTFEGSICVIDRSARALRAKLAKHFGMSTAGLTCRFVDGFENRIGEIGLAHVKCTDGRAFKVGYTYRRLQPFSGHVREVFIRVYPCDAQGKCFWEPDSESLKALLKREPWRLYHAEATPEIGDINTKLDMLRGMHDERTEMRRLELLQQRRALADANLAKALAEYQRERFGKSYLDI